MPRPASLPRVTSANGFHGVSCAEASAAESEQQGGDEGQGREGDAAHGGVKGKDGAALNSQGNARL